MDAKGFRHVLLFGRFQKTDQSLSGSVFMMMAGVARIGLLVLAACFQGGLGEHESEGVAVGVPGFADPRHLGHMAADTASKGMNSVDRAILLSRVAAFAQPVLKQPGLGHDGVQQAGPPHPGRYQGGPGFVYVVAGDTDYTHLGVFALLPVEILLVTVFGFP